LTNRDIYNSALRLASEVDTAGENQDYLERAGYLLPTVCVRCTALDAAYREATGGAKQVLPEDSAYRMDADFPLSSVFSAPASAALAALLVLEENPELSDRLNAYSEKILTEIRNALPLRKESIINHYPDMLP